MKSATGIQKYKVFWLCDKCKESDRHRTADLFWECDAADLCATCRSNTDTDFESKPRYPLRKDVWYWIQAKNVKLVRVMEEFRVYSVESITGVGLY